MLTAHPKKKVFIKLFEEQGQIPPDIILQDFQENQMVIPQGVSGLVPYGDRTINWKWTGPVFETQARDLLDTSIVVRNMQELGVGSLQAMDYLFPDKEPQELENMLTGVPFRFGQSVTQWLTALLGLQQQLGQIPDPYDPSMPMSARIDLTPVIQQQLLSLIKETSYGESYEPASNLTSPSFSSSSGLQYSPNNSSGVNPASGNGATANGLPNAGIGSNGATTSTNASLQQYYPLSPSNSGYAAGLQPVWPNPVQQPIYGAATGSNYPGFSLRPEWASPLPAAGGSTTGTSRPTPGLPGQSGVPTGSIPNLISNIPSDLYTASGQLSALAQQLYGSQLPIQPGSNTAGNGRKPGGKSKGSGNK
jgi:hypothetical protein